MGFHVKQFVVPGGALALLLSPLAVETASAEGFYGVVRVGQDEAQIEGFELDEGLTYGAAIGTSVGPFRVEAGVDRLSGDFGGGLLDGDALDYSASAFLDLNVSERASLFAGAGVDYVQAEANIFGSSIDASGSGWHYAVGGAYRLAEGIIAEVQWRQLDASVDADFIGEVDLEARSVTAGLRFAL